ncbi:uncharacterized protein SPSK_10042 [Sporothrix schenckii 1099-18]|uniref:Uncharacterized protein n=1 Tax=Sporothrix schenckii 1099-18 TaxID=1397361 RepID=A0A0F2M7Z2_SPOSC|nr:uncharacterized protein SPSK_10042 [Sporothrix schenckii 1099-18]KJR85199.1 hypothetical protein SPSK_10042 [Sporothrix schenckii 1099-18]
MPVGAEGGFLLLNPEQADAQLGRVSFSEHKTGEGMEIRRRWTRTRHLVAITNFAVDSSTILGRATQVGNEPQDERREWRRYERHNGRSNTLGPGSELAAGPRGFAAGAISPQQWPPVLAATFNL